MGGLLPTTVRSILTSDLDKVVLFQYLPLTGHHFLLWGPFPVSPAGGCDVLRIPGDQQLVKNSDQQLVQHRQPHSPPLMSLPLAYFSLAFYLVNWLWAIKFYLNFFFVKIFFSLFEHKPVNLGCT